MKIQKLALFVNPSKIEGQPIVSQVHAACAAAGILLLGSGVQSQKADSMHTALEAADALLVLGGDGTILHAVGVMAERRLPILGMNLGTIGFLAEFAPEELQEAVRRLATGQYRLEQRMLLQARVEGEDESCTALNDVVITRGSYARVLDMDVYIDGALAARYAGDGSVAATPTGSTAYSLSAGGPILAPGLECMVLAPICAHTLSSRTMVVSATSTVRMLFRPRGLDGGMMLSVDGAQGRILRKETALVIQRGKETLPFIRFTEKDHFFERLRCKLSEWGGGLPR